MSGKDFKLSDFRLSDGSRRFGQELNVFRAAGLLFENYDWEVSRKIAKVYTAIGFRLLPYKGEERDNSIRVKKSDCEKVNALSYKDRKRWDECDMLSEAEREDLRDLLGFKLLNVVSKASTSEKPELKKRKLTILNPTQEELAEYLCKERNLPKAMLEREIARIRAQYGWRRGRMTPSQARTIICEIFDEEDE